MGENFWDWEARERPKWPVYNFSHSVSAESINRFASQLHKITVKIAFNFPKNLSTQRKLLSRERCLTICSPFSLRPGWIHLSIKTSPTRDGTYENRGYYISRSPSRPKNRSWGSYRAPFLRSLSRNFLGVLGNATPHWSPKIIIQEHLMQISFVNLFQV